MADVAADVTQIASFSSVSNLSWTNSAMTVVRNVAQPVRNLGAMPLDASYALWMHFS